MGARNARANKKKNAPHKGSNNKARTKGKTHGYKLITILCVTATAIILTLLFSAIVLTHISEIMAARGEYGEYATLREAANPEPPGFIPPRAAPVYISAFDAEMREINADYVCWIKIEDTAVDYPVVRGQDNERYLNTSFSGEENILGALFMDYRCAGDYVPHIIIYGHYTWNGDMFGGLREFLDEKYLKEHPTITLTVNDRAVEYEIFAARKTDVTDAAYNLSFGTAADFGAFAQECGAPAEAAQIITLSTCASGDYTDERVIVQGMLKK